MDTLKAITTRRSVRNYTDEKFDSKLLIEIISYGFYAPSAHNQQAWKYYIISKQEDHNFLWEIMDFWKMLPNAWGVILACYDKDMTKSEEFIPQDMWASIQNILLAAHEKEIWTVRLWVYPHENVMKTIAHHFNFPPNVVPFALISLWKQNWEIPEKHLKNEWKIEII